MPAAPDWPALRADGVDLPEQLVYEWGSRSLGGDGEDGSWSVASPGFDRELAERSALWGLERLAVPASAFFWRVEGDLCYALHLRPGRREGAPGLLHLVSWKREPGVPAALGALLLLPEVARRATDAEVSAGSEDSPGGTIEVAKAGLEALLAEGPEDLAGLELERVYSELLARSRPAWLAGLEAPLSAAALACLLLPLPRTRADALSLAGWVPEGEEPAPWWDLVCAVEVPPEPAVEERDRQLAARMARALADNQPAGLEAAAEPDRPAVEAGSGRRQAPPGDAAGDGWKLALWGPTAAGKTALLAQLYIQAERDPGDWRVFPTEGAKRFIDQMEELFLFENRFPTGSAFGAGEQIVYDLRHRSTGELASLSMLDRAGIHYEEPDEESRDWLARSDGVLLLYDPGLGPSMESHLRRTLRLVYEVGGGGARKQPKPVAICLTKADRLIHTLDDYREALEEPAAFARKHLEPDLLLEIQRYCDDYRLFPVSAVGLRVRFGAIEPVVFYDHDLEARICSGGRPLHLTAPFDWILGRLTEPRR